MKQIENIEIRNVRGLEIIMHDKNDFWFPELIPLKDGRMIVVKFKDLDTATKWLLADYEEKLKLKGKIVRTDKLRVRN